MQSSAASGSNTDLISDPKLIDELEARGIVRSVAGNLLSKLNQDQLARAADWIEYWDEERKIQNVGRGLLYKLVKSSDPLPPSFEPRRMKQAREVAEQERRRQERFEQELEKRYGEFCRASVDRAIAELPAGEFERRVIARREQTVSEPGFWGQRPEMADQIARHQVRAEITNSIPLPTLGEFRDRERADLRKESDTDRTAVCIEFPESENPSNNDMPPEALYTPTTNDPPPDAVSIDFDQNSPPAGV
jgi:hypothetical protein